MFFEQTTPASSSFVDVSASVSSLAFTDKDLDPAEVGGNITWSVTNATQVTHYVVYFASNAIGASKSQIGIDLAPDVDQVQVDANTPKGIFTHILVYTKSSLVEQTTAVVLKLNDITSVVSGTWGPWITRRPEATRVPQDHSCSPRGELVQGWESEC